VRIQVDFPARSSKRELPSRSSFAVSRQSLPEIAAISAIISISGVPRIA